MDLSSVNWLDVSLGGVLVISTIVGLSRGLVSEALSLIAWIIAFVVAKKFTNEVAEKYVMQVFNDSLIANILAFVLIFALTLFTIGLINLVISQVLKATGLGTINTFIGGLFGALRGVIICTLAVFILQYTTIKDSKTWKESTLTPNFITLLERLEQTDFVQDLKGKFTKSEEKVKRVRDALRPKDDSNN